VSAAGRRSVTRRLPRPTGWLARLAVVAGLVVLACLGVLAWQLARPGAAQRSWSGVRLNQIQVLGTHNSYHQRLTAQERRYARLAGSQESSLDYAYPSVAAQLRAGARVLELDLYPDPTGGRYAHPLIRRLAGLPPLPGLDQPGTKVLHIADADYRSSCPTLSGCLAELAEFDRAQPEHSPVFVMLELKSSQARVVGLGGARSPAWDAATLGTVDAEISSALGDRVVRPDDVRRAGSTLEQSVLAGGWPSVAAARGQTVFAMLNPPGPVRTAYLAGHPDLAGREVFTNAEPGQPDAAFLKRDDPRSTDGGSIATLVSRGYLVRTRADDAGALAVARASGAQLISTNSIAPITDSGSRAAPGDGAAGPLNVVRCDPVSAGPGCPDGGADF